MTRKYLWLAAVCAAGSLSFLVGKHYGAALERERAPIVSDSPARSIFSGLSPEDRQVEFMANLTALHEARRLAEKESDNAAP